MRQEFLELQKLLMEQRVVLQELLELSYEKRQIVIGGDVERLSEITSGLQRGVAKLRNLERKQTKLLPGIAKLLKISADKLSLSGILPLVAADEREALSALRDDLIDLASSQVEINKINRELIETHLEYADAVIDAMLGEEDPINNFYESDGQSSPDKKKATGFFDQQV